MPIHVENTTYCNEYHVKLKSVKINASFLTVLSHWRL